MKLNEIESRIESIKNYIEVMEKAIECIKAGNQTCMCDYRHRCNDVDCNENTIDSMKWLVKLCIDSMHEEYYKR